MSQSVTYVLSLTDKMSGPMGKITGASAQTIGMLDKLQQQSKALKAGTLDLGGSLSTLRSKLQLLRGEKELINPKNLTDIKKYNREIKGLEKQIDKLDNAGNGGGLSRYFNDLKGSIGGLVNPLTVAATAIGFAAKSGMDIDEQFAKINITAQLEGADFDKLKADVIDVAKKNKVDISMAPGAYEKILSQTGDVDLSLQILDSTLKGSKAGFTDASVVADALAQTLSSVGKDAANADEILDTLFAAKRVGAGEFKDFANYIPGLVASGKSLQIGYKEVAGVYAYMTGKGNSAEKSAVYMKNMFSMLGRTEVTGKLSKAGVEVFDNGKIRSTVDIFKDLNKVMSTMNGEQQAAFMEKIGVVDQEAKAAFSLMASEPEKLQTALTDCANASGEADRALALSASSAQRAAELWADFKNKLTEFGTAILPIVNAGIGALSGAMVVVGTVLKSVASMFGSWYDSMTDGNPLIWGLTSALTAVGVLLVAHKVKIQAASLWNTIMTVTSGGLTKAIGFLNASLLASPLGWLTVGIAAAVGVMVALCSATDKASKAFSAFNTDLAMAKDESKDYFAAATNATQGTDARREAIAKINEKYGEYLPNLISENATNAELSTSLSNVNVQIERKLYNMAIEEIQKTKLDAKKQVLEYVADRVPKEKQQQALSAMSGYLGMMERGEMDFVGVQQAMENRFNVSFKGLEVLDVYVSKSGKLYNALGAQLADVQNVFYNAKQSLAVIDAVHLSEQPAPALPGSNAPYSTAAPGVTVVVQPTPPVFAPTFSPVFNPVISGNMLPTQIPSTVGAKPASSATTADQVVTNGTVVTGNGGGGGGGGGSTSTNVFDLDQQVVNKKGSTAYNAVVSKLGKVKVAGLAAASLAGVATTSPAMSVPSISEGLTTEMVGQKSGDQTNYSDPNRQKTLNLDKFCDQIVIHIAKADDQGMDQIRQKVINVLKEVADGQHA